MEQTKIHVNSLQSRMGGQGQGELSIRKCARFALQHHVACARATQGGSGVPAVGGAAAMPASAWQIAACSNLLARTCRLRSSCGSRLSTTRSRGSAAGGRLRMGVNDARNHELEFPAAEVASPLTNSESFPARCPRLAQHGRTPAKTLTCPEQLGTPARVGQAHYAMRSVPASPRSCDAPHPSARLDPRARTAPVAASLSK